MIMDVVYVAEIHKTAAYNRKITKYFGKIKDITT